MKKNIYHINPVIQKRYAYFATHAWGSDLSALVRFCREEELHVKNMEKKIRAARSALPSGAKAGPAAAPRTGQAKPPASSAILTDTAQLDVLIRARLQDLLGSTLIQDIQALVRHGPAPVPAIPRGPQRLTARSNSANRAAAVKPPRAAKRPPWNEEFAVYPPEQVAATSTSRPASSSRPAGGAGQVAPKACAPPQQPLPRAQSASPGLRDRPQARAETEQPSPLPAREQPARPKGRPPPSPGAHVVQLLAHLRSPAGSPGRPASALRYAGGILPPAIDYPDGGNSAPEQVTRSDAAAVSVLNPAAQYGLGVAAGDAPLRAAPGRLTLPQHLLSPSAQLASMSPAGTAAPKAIDASLMSLSRLSLIRSPGGAQRPAGGSGRPGPSQRAPLHSHPRQQQDATLEEEEDEYEEDFEEPEELQGSTQDRPPSAAHEVDVLRQSVALLNDLVQMRIHMMGATCSETSAESDFRSSDWMQAERGDALRMTQGLLGGDAEFGRSSLLLPDHAAAADGLLHQSDLEYLDRHMGARQKGLESNPGESLQDDDAVCMEAAAPVGCSGAWGMAAQAPTINVNSRPRQEGAAETGASSPEPGTGQVAGLAGEARALFTSLRQLHELMSGPRGNELSPRGELSPIGGFSMPTTPKDSLKSPPLPEDEDFLSVATIGQALLAQELGHQAADSADGLPGLQSEDQQLCTADVDWMASLMQTLSASLQDGGVWMQGDDVA